MQLSSSQIAPSTLAGSSLLAQEARLLRPDETALLNCLLQKHPRLQEALPEARVIEMRDDGMGSLRFAANHSQKLGTVIAEATAADADEIPLEISVNLDQNGELFELDIWRVDFSPLQRLPRPEELTVSF